MDYKELIEALKSMLPEKVLYGDLIGAEGVYAHSGPLVYEDPEPYFIEQAITAINDLLARAEEAEADNKKLCAAMMQLKRTDRPERMSVIYELEYDSSMSHKTMEEVAGIFFRGLMDADLKLRGQKEE